MKRLNCKLIVSDFDGTLADSENNVGAEVISAIDEYRSLGGIFAVCTGRILPSVLPRLRQIGLSGLVAASQGSTIADIATGRIIREAGMSCRDAAEICAALEEFGATVQVYTTYGFYTDIDSDNPSLKLYEQITGITAKHTDRKLSEFVGNNCVKALKIASLCYAEDRERLYEYLLKRFGDRFEITCSAAVLVEVSPKGETKGSAVKFLSEYYRIPLSETVAVGDNLNDLAMIEAAGTGVAVGNAVEELKAHADFVTVTNDEGAVKRVIEEFGYIYE